MTFDDAVTLIFDFEGGLVEDPTDPGGLTNFGISQRSYPKLDIRHLTRDQARDIYRRDYWDRCRCDDLPHGVDFLVFDMAVDQGADVAVSLLQGIIGAKKDGIVGTETIRKTQQDPDILGEYAAQRTMHYIHDPLFGHDGLGWIRRTMSALILAAQDK